MKTLSYTLGLLLLLTVYCAAIPNAVNEIAPGPCCFKFFPGAIPQQEIVFITKTHSRCHKKGFVVSAANGKEICVKQNVRWANIVYNKQLAIRA
ncbi:C-C motif chemokine 3-like [Thunnus albacares]|uniref:C-C motif chemokine 3-like n=1 Tax=Thunnus albacares TaxID=8236 RepID=UPI001CF638E8|nr:C-C motif chemokine 3-like [Thunnus albacares]